VKDVKKETWIVWLTEPAGEMFLGLPAAARSEQRRFCVIGVHEGEGPSGVGVWIRVNHVREINVASNAAFRTWEVAPPLCLILWSYIAYIQKGDDLDRIGFALTKSK
jgi:hypothetical protein